MLDPVAVPVLGHRLHTKHVVKTGAFEIEIDDRHFFAEFSQSGCRVGRGDCTAAAALVGPEHHDLHSSYLRSSF